MKKLIIPLISFLMLCGCLNNHHELRVDGHEFKYYYYGKVVKVVDGDTVYVDVNGELWKIRLLGVDTPEIHKKNNPYEYYLLNGTPITNTTYLKLWGYKAKHFAERELLNKEVIIVFDKNLQKDRYGRYLAYIYLNESGHLVNFNELLLKEGYARVYISDFSLKNEFLKIEREAKERRVGLWGYN
ncbi:calcium-activated nuclease EcnA [Methanocaldococcus indicus]|uniref:calcium-activated nuclease EcnA n=1 Tax=Methanocaldococcus indicus TaxID=213231 RepID=UPI003C6D33A1